MTPKVDKNGQPTFMRDSSEARSKGLPLYVVMSLAMTTFSFRLGTWNRNCAGVVVKLLVGYSRQGGALKTGLQACSEEEKQLERNNRDSWRIHSMSPRVCEENRI